jgi:tetratricopeptide (TPR) repeat protein
MDTPNVLPDNQDMKKLDCEMQKGYDLLLEDKHADALQIWSDAWRDIKRLMEQYETTDIEAFDAIFKGTQLVYNWASDFAMELGDAAHNDRRYCQPRIDFCREYIERCKDSLELNAENMRADIAETYYILEQADEGYRLFELLLDEDPIWGWGWIRWSEQYYLFKDDYRDVDTAIDILKRGLEIPDLESGVEVLERLLDIYSDLDMEVEAAEIEKRIKEITLPPVDRQNKVGYQRSGFTKKKFKPKKKTKTTRKKRK